METEFNDTISKLEAVIRDIEVFEKRLKNWWISWKSKSQRWGNNRIRSGNEAALDIEALGKHEAKFEAEKERLENEKLKKAAMYSYF